MIKITFEISEDFIREKSDLDKALKSAKDKGEVLVSLTDAIGFNQLNNQIEEGKTEFVVTKDKLDKVSKEIYDMTIGRVCILAAFSEKDKVQNKE